MRRRVSGRIARGPRAAGPGSGVGAGGGPAGPDPPRLEPPDLIGLPRADLEAMREAGREVLECRRALAAAGRNAVGEMLDGRGTFRAFDHYPPGDVYDDASHAQYYYHAHRGMPGEHGHFHTFLRGPGIPTGVEPAPYDGAAERPLGDEALAHLVAVSMDAYGTPIGFFAVNRWVTAESWYSAGDVVAMLDRFSIDHAHPSRPVNRWLSALLRLFRPEIGRLLRQRDEAIAAWRAARPDRDVYEDRELEITGVMPVLVEGQVTRVEAALAAARG